MCALDIYTDILHVVHQLIHVQSETFPLHADYQMQETAEFPC